MSLEIDTPTKASDIARMEDGRMLELRFCIPASYVGDTPRTLYKKIPAIVDITRPIEFPETPERFSTYQVLELGEDDIEKAVRQYVRHWYPNEIRGVFFKIGKTRTRKTIKFFLSHVEVRMEK